MVHDKTKENSNSTTIDEIINTSTKIYSLHTEN